MAVSARDLQHEYESIQGHCPALLPSVLPRGYDVEDLWGLAHTEGKTEKESLKQFLLAAVKRARASSSCCVCEAVGDPIVNSSTQEDEAHALRFTTFSKIDFTNRSIQLTGAGFACGCCRALLEPQRFLLFVALRLNDRHPERVILAQKLCAHLALVNCAPEHVQTNPDALVLWVQELMSRACALQIVASNVGGWRLVGPAGELIRQGARGTSTALAKALLEAGCGSTSRLPHPKSASKLEPKGKAASGSKRSRKAPAAAPSPAAPSSDDDLDEQPPPSRAISGKGTPFPLLKQTPGPKQQIQQQQHQQVGQDSKHGSENKKRRLQQEGPVTPVLMQVQHQGQLQGSLRKQQQPQPDEPADATPQGVGCKVLADRNHGGRDGHGSLAKGAKHKAAMPGPSVKGDQGDDRALSRGGKQAGQGGASVNKAKKKARTNL